MSDFLTAFDELNQAMAGEGDRLAALPMTLIDEDANNPRDTFDPLELEALAATIRDRGVLQPIVVRPADGMGRYRIRFGSRRYRAAQLAGLTDIPALIRSGGEDAADLLIEQVIENDQRAALSTAQMARTVAQLQEKGLTQAEIGARLGRTKDRIAMLAAVQTMPTVLQDLAAGLGPRTLYELFQGWKASPSAVEAWLEGRDPQTITQAQARALAAPGRMDRVPAIVPQSRQLAATTVTPLTMTVEVRVRGRQGHLVLSPGPSADVVLVDFADAAAVEPVETSLVELVQVVARS